MEPIQSIVPEGTPLPPAPVGVPPYPITPFAVWTWSTPVIPEFYWNIYSSEQRIKSICKEIGKIESYLQYLVTKTNENIIELHKRIDVLTERVAALEKHVEEEVARLDGLIAQLRADLEQEIADREQGDANLDKRITQEIHDRQDADQVLHGEISQEVQDRTHADDALHEEISTETQARIHADDQLHDEISHRLLPTDVKAGAEIEITRPDPNSNTIVIASTVAHSIADLASTVSGLQAALTAETEERRADDASLWTAVNNRIERGKILAGTGIKVENDPDSSTVTISATGGGTGGATEITGTAPITVTDGEDGEKIVGVSAATEDSAGVITEARVRELAAGEGTAYTAGAGISISGNQISIDPSGTQAPFTQGVNNRVVANIVPSSGAQAGKVSSNIQFEAGTGMAFDHNGALKISAKTATESAAGIITEARVKELAGGVAPSLSAEAPLNLEDGTISVNEITPETSSETETGVVSKATIKSLALDSGGVYPGLAPYGGLEQRPSGLTVAGVNDTYNPIGVDVYGNFTLTGRKDVHRLNTKVIDLTIPDYSETFFTPFSCISLAYAGSENKRWMADFVLTDGFFEVKNGDEDWHNARLGCFELYAEAEMISTKDDSQAKGYPVDHVIYIRTTPRGQAIYTSQDPGDTDKEKITHIKVTYSVYNLYISPPDPDFVP